MTSSTTGDITKLLNRAQSSDGADRDKLASLVHLELRKIAARMMESERRDHTLQATALATDAFMGLVGNFDQNWQNRAHFFGLAARAMRQILVDHSRKRNAQKRGGGQERLDNPDELTASIRDSETLLALDQALTRLSAKDPRQAEVVELRYFGGLTEEEIAEVWGISLRTVKREWSAARAWLYAELSSSARPKN